MMPAEIAAIREEIAELLVVDERRVLVLAGQRICLSVEDARSLVNLARRGAAGEAAERTGAVR